MMQTMLQSSALIVLTLVLRRLLRGRVSQRAVCLLWAPVLIRLSLPGVFWALPVKPAAGSPVQQTAAVFRQTIPRGEPVPNIFEAANTASYIAVDWRAVLATVWTAGTFALLLWTAAVNLRFAERLRRTRSPLAPCGRLPVYAAAGLASPCLALVHAKPGIYIPEELAEDAAQLRHILAHETAHARRLDPLWELFRLGLTVLYWWNPLIWLAASCSRQDAELACDEAALDALGESERLAYGRTLIRLAAHQSRPCSAVCAAPMSSGGRAIRERIRQLAHKPRRSKSAAMLAFLLIAVGGAAAFTTVGAAESPLENAEIYTRIQNKPAKTHWTNEFSFPSGGTTAGEIAKDYFDTYADHLQAHWAASGYPLEKVALLALNVPNPDAPAEAVVEFTAVYAVKPETNPFLSSRNLSGLLDGFVPGYGALEGYLLAAEPKAVMRGADGDWETIPAKMPALQNGYRSLTLEEVLEFASLKEPCFEDFLRYHAEEGGSNYFRSYSIADAPCTLYTARKNETDAPLYLALVNSETGESADLRAGLSAVCAAAGVPRKTILTEKDLAAAIAVVEEFIASHPVWQDAEIRYDPYLNALNHDISLGVYERGYQKENVLTLLCDFTAGDGPVLEPGERYTDYQFILARHSEQEPWEIADMGY